MTGQSLVLRWLCCGPEISGPQHDQIVWSYSGPETPGQRNLNSGPKRVVTGEEPESNALE